MDYFPVIHDHLRRVAALSAIDTRLFEKLQVEEVDPAHHPLVTDKGDSTFSYNEPITHYAIFICIFFFSQVTNVAAGIGFGLLVHTGWNLATMAGLLGGGLGQVVGYITLGNLIVAPMQVYLLRKEVCWRLVFVVSVLWACSSIPGFYVLNTYENSGFLIPILGFILAFFYLYSLCDLHRLQGPNKKTVDAEKFNLTTWRNFGLAVLLGLLGGFFAGLFALPLPAFLIFNLIANMPKDQWRASVSAMVSVSLPLSLWYFYVQEQMFETSRIWDYILALSISALALPFGNFVSGKLDQMLFRKVVTCLTWLGAWSLISSYFSIGFVVPIIVVLGWLPPFLLHKLSPGYTRGPEQNDDASTTEKMEELERKKRIRNSDIIFEEEEMIDSFAMEDYTDTTAGEEQGLIIVMGAKTHESDEDDNIITHPNAS